MLAVQTNTNTSMLPVVYDDAFNQPQLKSLVYKSMLPVYETKIPVRNASKTRTQLSSMGLVIPFQPCMWDDKTIDAAWNNALHMVKTKIKDKYSEECTDKILLRLQKSYTKLNFNTHRKSLAIILTPAEEKIIYLSFPVMPLVFFAKNISVLELASNIQQEPDLYYLVANKDYTTLYNYNHNQLRKVYEQSTQTCRENLFKDAALVIELLTSENAKPVYITGSPNLVEGFRNSPYCPSNSFTFLYDTTTFSNKIIQSLVKEITGHWSYWRSKFIAGSVLLSQKANRLISHTEAVLQALRRGADGLLLIDKRLKRQLQKPVTGNSIFQIAHELINQIEKFLTRGNGIEITETGLLKDLGGIVLLQDKPCNREHKSYYRYAGIGGSLY